MRTKEIIICEACKGYGYVEEEYRVGYEDYENVNNMCIYCGGSGKLTKITSVTFQPFNENLNQEEKLEKICYDCMQMRGDRDDHKCINCKNNIYHKVFYFDAEKTSIANPNYIGE